jgi:AcrR family transcriptional regulator
MPTPASNPPRQRLLEAASRLFYEHGIAATGIDRVLAEAGVAKMTLYNAFGSKDGLVVEYLRGHYCGFLAALRQTLEERHAEAPARLLGVFDVLDEWFRSEGFRGCPLLHAAVEFSESAHPAREAVAGLAAQLQAYLEEQARAAGAPDPTALAEELCLLAYGAITWALITRSPAPALNAKRLARGVLVERGLLRREEQSP